jgi:hypothetical protein
LRGEVLAEWGGNGFGKGEGGDIVNQGAGVTLGSNEASEDRWGIVA